MDAVESKIQEAEPMGLLIEASETQMIFRNEIDIDVLIGFPHWGASANILFT